MGGDVGDALVADLLGLNFAELELSLLSIDRVLDDALDGNDILEANGVQMIGTNLMVNLDEPLDDDELDLTVGQSILETVAEQEEHGEAITRLVGPGGRLRGEGARQ